jgi:hypothetical protein
VYTHGSGIRARRKRWFLAVAGSRTGHPLQGKVSGGMTLAVFTCRGRPAALNRATLRRYGSLWDGSSLGTFRRAVLRQPALALLSVIDGLCVTPLAVPPAVPLLQGFGTCQGTCVPRPQLMEPPSPRSGSPCVSGTSVAPADILKWVALAASYLMRQWTESPGIRRRPPLFWKLAPPIASCC